MPQRIQHYGVFIQAPEYKCGACSAPLDHHYECPSRGSLNEVVCNYGDTLSETLREMNASEYVRWCLEAVFLADIPQCM